MQKVSEIAKKCLMEERVKDGVEWDSLWYGEPMLLDEIFYRAFPDALNFMPHTVRHQRVLNALDRERKREDAIFVKKYINIECRRARIFELKK